MQKVNAVTLSGGSAFGLSSAGGVTKYLHENNLGYTVGAFCVPIVCGASVFDLDYKNFAYPGEAEGYEAAANALTDNFEKGSIGGGTGATISKVLGAASRAKSGLGVATLSLNGLEIAVLCVVNAVGDIIGGNGKIIHGGKDSDGNYIDCTKILTEGSYNTTDKPAPSAVNAEEINLHAGANTTISCIITNADLTKEQCNELADIANDGYATAISPAHSPFDGDCIFVLASGGVKISYPVIAAIIPKLTAQAVRSVAEDSNSRDRKKVNPFLFKLINKFIK
ncbi:MAG: P1 family peptidase [Christensenellaceae bacterium]|nr:P1 family peptidase [Christensenellaceae bacterium]